MTKNGKRFSKNIIKYTIYHVTYKLNKRKEVLKMAKGQWFIERVSGDHEYNKIRENANYRFKKSKIFTGGFDDSFFDNPEALKESTYKVITKGKRIIQAYDSVNGGYTRRII